MKIRTVADLSRHLETSALSPEAFSQQCVISNMTIRRLLTKKPTAAVPQKYWAALDLVTQPAAEPSDFSWQDLMGEDFETLAQTLEEEGKGEHDLNKMADEISLKTKALEVGKKLKTLVSSVFSAVKDGEISKRDQFIAIGALMYFLNPFDLIPDAMVGVGYLDDYAVLTMVAARLSTPKSVAEKFKKVVKK